MDQNQEDYIKQIKKLLEELPAKKQKAVFWIIQNWEIANELCSNSTLTTEEIDKHMKSAEEHGDELLVALLTLYRILEQQKKEKHRTEFDC